MLYVKFILCFGIFSVSTLVAQSLPGTSASIQVKPIFFSASDMPLPTETQKSLFQKHLLAAQTRYFSMLLGRDTFTIAGEPVMVQSVYPLSWFLNSEDQGAAKIITELFKHFGTDKQALPWVMVVIFMNPHGNFPAGGGRPVNGGLNNGGGFLEVSSFELDKASGNFQSTLQHELGHSFGLVHTETYGYSQDTGDSIMSYNPAHHWKGLNPPATQGILIPEDLQALALNKKVFPRFYFDPKADLPDGYALKSVKFLPPMPTENQGKLYRLKVNGKIVLERHDFTARQALENFIHARKSQPSASATYAGNSLKVTGGGYELYFNGKRVNGPDAASYTLEQARKNLDANTKNRPFIEVVGVYKGEVMPSGNTP